jgi:hypothetical protein
VQEHVTPVVKQQEKIVTGRRALRAHFARISPKPRYRRTGTTPHFRMWMADLALKSSLQKTRLNKIVASEQGAGPKTGAVYALLAPVYKNVYALTQANREDLLAVKGIGPAKLALVEADLKSHNVAVRWAA